MNCEKNLLLLSILSKDTEKVKIKNITTNDQETFDLTDVESIKDFINQ